MICIDDFEPDIYDTDDETVRQCARELIDGHVNFRDDESVGEFLMHMQDFINERGRMPDHDGWRVWRQRQYRETYELLQKLLTAH